MEPVGTSSGTERYPKHGSTVADRENTPRTRPHHARQPFEGGGQQTPDGRYNVRLTDTTPLPGIIISVASTRQTTAAGHDMRKFLCAMVVVFGCRPEPHTSADPAMILTEPEQFLNRKVTFPLSLTGRSGRAYEKRVDPDKKPLFVVVLAPGEPEPTIPGKYLCTGIVEGYSAADTGLLDRPYTVLIRDCRLRKE